MGAYSGNNNLDITLNLFVCLSGNSSKKIRYKGIRFSEFDWVTQVLLQRSLMKFGEVVSKNPVSGAIFFFFFFFFYF